MRLMDQGEHNWMEIELTKKEFEKWYSRLNASPVILWEDIWDEKKHTTYRHYLLVEGRPVLIYEVPEEAVLERNP